MIIRGKWKGNEFLRWCRFHAVENLGRETAGGLRFGLERKDDGPVAKHAREIERCGTRNFDGSVQIVVKCGGASETQQ
ncbi:MAG TPA: hypothetical protein VJR23_05215 [Candidatus Acidoferrales bacterium]|nr:hypothetical protein [Candidatus Acidoferrales bacterium]